MGVLAEYNDIQPLTGADLPDKLTAADAPAKFTQDPGTTLALGLKLNEAIDTLNKIGGRLNELIDTTALVGTRTNDLINVVNWLGNGFENIELIGLRNYLAYVPGKAPEGAPDVSA